MLINTAMFLPELFLGVFSLGLLFLGLYRPGIRGKEETSLQLALPKGASYGVLILLLVLLGFLWFAHIFQGISFSGFLISDKMSILSKAFICLIGLSWIGFDNRIIESTLERDGIKQFEYPVLCLVSIIGSFLMVSAHHLLAIYFGIALQTIPLYVLISLKKGGGLSKESALKYFLLGSLSSLFLLYGIALVYGFVGSGDFREISTSLEWLTENSLGYSWLQAGFLFIVIGLLFKLGLASLNPWGPDISQGVSNAQMPFLLLIPKISGAILLVRLLFGAFHGLHFLWKPLLLSVALISLVMGSVGAFSQTNIRRFFSYMGLFHMGFFLLGLSSKEFNGAYAGLLYLFIFSGTTLGFLFFWTTLSTNDRNLDKIPQVKGLLKKQPVVAGILCLLLLSLAGLPPFAGFWTTLYLMSTVISGGSFIIGISLASALISAIGYLKIIKVICFEEGHEEIHSTFSWTSGWILLIPFVILFFTAQDFFLEIIREALSSL